MIDIEYKENLDEETLIRECKEELEKDIIEYMDYYNNKRIKSKLKGMSPVQYRFHFLDAA